MADTLVKVIFGIIIGLVLVLALLNIGEDILSSFFGSKGCNEAYGYLGGLSEAVDYSLSGEADYTNALFSIEGKCSLVGFSKIRDSFLARPNECLSESCLCLCKGKLDEKCNVYEQCSYFDVDVFIGDAEVNGVKEQVFFQNTDGILLLNVIKKENSVYITLRDVSEIIVETSQENEIINLLEVDEAIRARVDSYSSVIDRATSNSGIDPVFVKSIIAKESEGVKDAVSEARAVGLMQLTEDTARGCGLNVPEYPDGAPCDKTHKENCNQLLDERFNPEKNIQGGVCVIKELIGRYESNLAYVLAAYNAGPNPRWDCDKERRGIEYCPIERYGVPPFEETQEYVELVLGHYEWYNSIA